MQFAGYFTSRYGCRPVIICSTIALCLLLPLLSSVAWLPGLTLAVAAFGACMGMLDCAMNIQSVIVERNSGQSLLSGFHGHYSVGGILGAAAMTGLLSCGFTPLMSVLGIITVVAAALYKATPDLLSYANEKSGPLFAVPKGIVLLLGVLCFIVFIAEGAILDWSAVFLISVKGMDTTYAGLGYACYAATMTVGRLFGDAIVDRLGGVIVVLLGGLCASTGLVLSIAFEGWPASLLGYALVGAGCSNIIPVLFSAVGRQQRMSQGLAVPAVISMGYAGILIGPVLIGLVAHLSNLSAAIGGLAILLVLVSAASRYLRVQNDRC